jgi:hypothetical protein
MARTEMNTEYFSGSQASIFIGDVWVDEIVDWQCSYGANAQPIYGYGSTFFSHAAQGRVLVQGSFTINFKEPNYLFAILSRYQRYKNLTLINDKLGQEIDSAERDNPYSPAEKVQELTYLDKRSALDNFFNNGKSDTVANNLLKKSTLSTLDPRLVNDFAIPMFDIKIGYGTVLDENTIGEQIVGVKLVGKGKTIMANGEPLKESYSFFAQNLV